MERKKKKGSWPVPLTRTVLSRSSRLVATLAFSSLATSNSVVSAVTRRCSSVSKDNKLILFFYLLRMYTHAHTHARTHWCCISCMTFVQACLSVTSYQYTQHRVRLLSGYHMTYLPCSSTFVQNLLCLGAITQNETKQTKNQLYQTYIILSLKKKKKKKKMKGFIS